MICVFDQYGRCIGVAFRPAPKASGVQVDVYNQHGKRIGIAYGA